jgi:hypothetical protein
MRNRIGRYCGDQSDVDRAKTTLAFCDAMWQLHADPNALPERAIDSLTALEHAAAAILRRNRLNRLKDFLVGPVN